MLSFKKFLCLLLLVTPTLWGNMEPTPKYLYKILSFRNWQSTQRRNAVALSAEDDAFIHFSKEDQLQRILTKYWAEALVYVVLKIDAEKLEGNMQYETNPGGTAKYYHLYNGHIPLNSVVEARVVYKNAPPKSGLEIVELGDPILRQRAKPLTQDEIASKEIQELIHEMKQSMEAAPGVGLAAPQIGKSIQLVVIEDMDHSHLTEKQIIERERSKVPFHVIINPKIHLDETESAEFFEGCLSVPCCLGRVSRAKSVRVECLDEYGKPKVIQAKGWYARILQHEIDHLNGTLFVDRADIQTLTTDENYQKFWK